MNIVQKRGGNLPKIIDQPKEIILNTARQILQNEGYDKLSIRELSKKSGVSIGTIYNYFKDKNALDMFLIASFWEEYEKLAVELLKNEDKGFYEKIRLLRLQLDDFVSVFKDLFYKILRNSISLHSDESTQSRLKMIKRISAELEILIIKENPKLKEASPNSEEISDWIMSSIIGINNMYGLDFDILEKIIKKVIS